jgi:hypothetical protein
MDVGCEDGCSEVGGVSAASRSWAPGAGKGTQPSRHEGYRVMTSVPVRSTRADQRSGTSVVDP